MPLLDRAPRPAIPTEVVERIIDIVAEPVDRADGVGLKARADTLHACTLVAQSWMPRSRVHLYRDVVLSSDWRTRRFLNSLTQSPPLGQYVEILRVWPRNDDEMTCGWIFKALSTLPPLLPHLRELALCHLPDLRQECIVILSRFSTVESLVLFDVKQSLREVVLLISRFPHLRRLYVDRGNWELPGRCFSRKKHNLTTLHVVASPPDCERSLLEWALASKSTGALTSIRARCDDSGSAMDRVLQTCCSTFQELYLEFYGTSTGEWLWMSCFCLLTCSLRSSLAHKFPQTASSRFVWIHKRGHSCARSSSSFCTKLPCRHLRLYLLCHSG